MYYYTTYTCMIQFSKESEHKLSHKSTRFDWVTSVLVSIYKVWVPWDQKDAFDTL
jgi:hypothetical protein